MKVRGCLIPTLGIFVILIALIAIMIDVGTSDDGQNKSTSQKYIDNLTQEQGLQIDSILNDCGIENITSIDHDELLDNAHEEKETGYRIKCDRADNVILYLNGDMGVHSVRYSNHNLYKKGKVRATIQDYTFSIQEVSNYKSICEEKVKNVLKSPSTAKFPNINEWGFGKNKKKITIQGYVDAQNSFGAEIRSNFQIIVDRKTDTISSFIFDGKELIQ